MHPLYRVHVECTHRQVNGKQEDDVEHSNNIVEQEEEAQSYLGFFVVLKLTYDHILNVSVNTEQHHLQTLIRTTLFQVK